VPKTIIVPLDGSELAERALTPAAALAKRTGAHVIVMTSQIGGVVVEPKHYLADVAAQARISDADVVVNRDRSVVSALKLIVADAADPVVCMSTHGRSGLGQALLGSSAEQAIHELRMPLLLIGPHVDPELAIRFESVVVCTDGTSTSQAIIAAVSNWIRDLRLQVWAVHVLDPKARRSSAVGREESATEFGAVNTVAESLPTPGGVGVKRDVLRRGDIADAIVEYARDVLASLIAMATHGRTGFARFALGSVTSAVVHRAPCPVLVVRPKGLVDVDETG
jgi:nucleotide-binding universal stress UspA family protein